MKRQEAVLRHDLEIRAREVCAFYEWSDPPNLAMADTLQSVADALKSGALSVEAGAALLAVTEPFAGLESAIGNGPPAFEIAESDAEMQAAIVGDLRRWIARETNPAKRVHLTRLMEKQIRNFAEGKR